jgi:hypothetical protein
MKRYILYGLPVVFLVLFLFRLPVPVPAVLLPRTVFLTYDRSLDAPSVFSYLRKHPRIHLLVGGTARALRRADFTTTASLAGYLEEYPNEEVTLLETYAASIAAQTPPLTRVRIVFSRQPQHRDMALLQRLQKDRGIPVEIEVISSPDDPLFLGYSYTTGSRETALDFDLLFASDIHRYESIEVYRNDDVITRLAPGALAEGRHYRTVLPGEEDSTLEFRIRDQDTVLRRRLFIPSQGEEDPQVLMISDREGNVSFLERFYTVKKTPLSQTLGENLLEYPLVVFDGIPLQSIDPMLTEIMKGIYEQRSTSLLFVSDSPSFGRRGDNPAIEEILPVELAPRTLRYLPDMGILIVLDISASMSGEKLSLAKVSTLELIKNLKDSDRISILTFWDQFRFLHDFEEKINLDSEVQLAPLVAQGGTDLFAALEEGMQRLSELLMPQRHVIILTDGKTKEGDFDSLIELAQLEDITVSTLAVGEEVNAGLLTRLAVTSGGNYYRVNKLEEIPSLIFEDRREIARSSFAEDLFPISDFEGTPVSQVSGMSLYTPKSERILLYKNQYEDPLLLLEKRDRQLVAMLLSDLYGYYTGDFLSTASVTRTLQRTFDSVLQKNRISLRIGESYGNVSVTVNGEGLIDPVLAVYADNRLLAEENLNAGSFLTYSASLPLSRTGRYSAILYSGGVPLTRFPLFFNGNMEGQSTESHMALQTHRTRLFRSLPASKASKIYLVLFFIASIAVTFLSRQSRGKAETGKQ